MEPFVEKPIDDVASISFCTYRVEANGGVSGGASHKFNAIRHSQETAEIAEVQKLQKSSRWRNCKNRMQCFNLGAAIIFLYLKKHTYGDINKLNISIIHVGNLKHFTISE